ncbi:MAG: arsenate reductase (azurin) small subunit [Aestuariivirgaceae bacterium]
MATQGNDNKNGLNRRSMLSLSAVAGLSAGLGTVANRPVQAEEAKMPAAEIAKLADLEPGARVDFDYPDENSPAILLRMQGPVDGGIGPDQSVVAFSMLCTHKGCPLTWNAEQKMLICPCHWSSFDPAKEGRMIIGQASQGLPQITLTLDGGMIRAVGVEGLIYGRQTNIL